MVVTQRETIVPLLTNNTQLCLAHYCDTHGPTPLMVTEGLPVPCGQCFDELSESDRPRTSGTNSPVPSVSDALRKLTLSSNRSSSVPVSDRDAQAHQASLLRTSKLAAVTPNASAASVIETPPQSPRKGTENLTETNSQFSGIRRDSSFRRTYDDNVTKRANPCQNCALTLPKRQGGKAEKTDAPSGTSDSKSDDRNPTLRTRTPYARVYGSGCDASPPTSHPQSECTSDTEEDVSPKNPKLATSRHRPTSSASRSSSSSSRSNLPQHTHFLDYTSAHEPLVATTYSIVRASCLRTLSFETLPRRPEAPQQGVASPAMSPHYSSLSPQHGPGYITSAPTPQSAAAGGPIFFGDPLAGYTTAYIFRIPDRHARGRKRVYAFIALSTHRERLAMKAFNFLSVAFRDLANWIQELAEAEAERERDREEEGSAVAALNAAYGNGGFGGGGPHDSGIGLGLGGGLGGGSVDHDRERDRDGSSFLTGGGRGHGFMHRMGGSMGPGGFAPKARGLAEIVGLPDVFIQLHSRFVRILLELGVVLGS